MTVGLSSRQAAIGLGCRGESPTPLAVHAAPFSGSVAGSPGQRRQDTTPVGVSCRLPFTALAPRHERGGKHGFRTPAERPPACAPGCTASELPTRTGRPQPACPRRRFALNPRVSWRPRRVHGDREGSRSHRPRRPTASKIQASHRGPPRLDTGRAAWISPRGCSRIPILAARSDARARRAATRAGIAERRARVGGERRRGSRPRRIRRDTRPCAPSVHAANRVP